MALVQNERFPSRLIAVLLTVSATVAAGAQQIAVAADDVSAEIAIRNHKFEPDQIKVPSSKTVKLTVKNLDASGEEFESKALGIEKVVAGNSSVIVRIKPLAAGKYSFVGEYHEDTAKGSVVAE